MESMEFLGLMDSMELKDLLDLRARLVIQALSVM